MAYVTSRYTENSHHPDRGGFVACHAVPCVDPGEVSRIEKVMTVGQELVI